MRFRFIAGLFVFAFLFTVVFIFFFGSYDFGPSELDDFMEILGVGMMFGLLLCGVPLPFTILMFKNPHYRQILKYYLPLI